MHDAECRLWFCHDKSYAQGLCLRHYRNKERNGGEVRLGRDARALLSHIMREQVLIASIVEGCWEMRLDGASECRYCGCTRPNHSPRCIVLTAESLVVK